MFMYQQIPSYYLITTKLCLGFLLSTPKKDRYLPKIRFENYLYLLGKEEFASRLVSPKNIMHALWKKSCFPFNQFLLLRTYPRYLLTPLQHTYLGYTKIISKYNLDQRDVVCTYLTKTRILIYLHKYVSTYLGTYLGTYLHCKYKYISLIVVQLSRQVNKNLQRKNSVKSSPYLLNLAISIKMGSYSLF